MSKQKIEFVLFLDPTSRQFLSFSPSKGYIVRENVPEKIKAIAEEQLEEYEICLDGVEFKYISSFQRRPIPMHFLLQRKFKYPVYYTEEYFSPCELENYKFNEIGQLVKDNLIDYISATVYLKDIMSQLESSKKQINPEYVTTDIKLIASINEVIRTVNRIILEKYGVVITMKTLANKLIFKIKDKDEYLYGNESIVNFQYVRDCLRARKPLVLEIMEVSIHDKEQFQRFVFTRDAEDITRGEFPSFNWQEFQKKTQNQKPQFLMWHAPEDVYTHPETFISIENLYSKDELIRTNQKIKLKLQEKKRLQIKKTPRFLWKDRIFEFIQKRKNQIKSKFIEIQGSIIYSGESAFIYEFEVSGLSNLMSIFSKNELEQRVSRRKFLKFQSKEMFLQNNYPANLPSAVSRFMQFAEIKKQGLFPIIPYMVQIEIQFAIGCRILDKRKTSEVIAGQHCTIRQKIEWIVLAKIPMESSIIFKVRLYSKQGQGLICGIGVLKLFDEFGFLLQGKQEVQIYPTESLEMFRIGCIDKFIEKNANLTKITINLPKFRNPVMWTLSDSASMKLLGYVPKFEAPKVEKQMNLQKLNELLRYDPLAIYRYTEEDKDLLRSCKKYYKHQSEKLINYLFTIDWKQPAQIAEAYTTLNQWAPLKPIQALFLLNPHLTDEKVRYYAVKRMENFLDFEFVLYSNQITQALVSFETHCNPLIDLVIQKCVTEPNTIGIQYFWQFKNRVSELYTKDRFCFYLELILMTTSFRRECSKQVEINNYLVQMNQKLIQDTKNISNFVDKNKKFLTMLDSVETSLMKIDPSGFNFPIRPQETFKCLDKEKCKMYDSKKLPFSLACCPEDKKTEESYKIMFKYGDDLKQDHLILQIFRVFNQLWCSAGLDLKMNIYRVLSTGNEIGFIELVEAENNSKIHKDFGKGIIEAFDATTTLQYLVKSNPIEKDSIVIETKDNKKESVELKKAKENYIRSSAGYLVATYVMGIGDRHSGNVMVQKNGKFFHIDFGHILGNFKQKMGVKRQRTPVLFTSQFLYVMGGAESKQYLRFQDLCSKAFNILRKHSFLILNLLTMMVSAEIPQLKRLADIAYAAEKLHLELSDTQAAEKLINTIKETLLSEKSRNIDNAFHEANREG